MPNEYPIIELTIDQYDDIVACWANAGLPYRPKGRDSREMLAVEMALEFTATFGIYDADRLIGVALANWDGRRGWVNRLAVHPDYRGQGLAGRLIARCEEFLAGKGALVMSALIEDINYPSISTFQRAGYEVDRKWLYFSKRPSWDV